MTMDEKSWDSFSRGSAVRRAVREGFARNVAVALGNWGDPGAAPVLWQGLKDPDPLVRAHAAWARGQVGSAEALAVLDDRLLFEEMEPVCEEIERALERRSSRRKYLGAGIARDEQDRHAGHAGPPFRVPSQPAPRTRAHVH
jgi:hypothetical protein